MLAPFPQPLQLALAEERRIRLGWCEGITLSLLSWTEARQFLRDIEEAALDVLLLHPVLGNEGDCSDFYEHIRRHVGTLVHAPGIGSALDGPAPEAALDLDRIGVLPVQGKAALVSYPGYPSSRFRSRFARRADVLEEIPAETRDAFLVCGSMQSVVRKRSLGQRLEEVRPLTARRPDLRITLLGLGPDRDTVLGRRIRVHSRMPDPFSVRLAATFRLGGPT